MPLRWTRNDRSIKISPAGMQVTIDLVPTAAPSEIQREFLESLDPDFQIEARGEADQQPVRLREAFERLQKAAGLERWQREPLLIPSRDLQTWVPTHPPRADPLDTPEERPERRSLRQRREGHPLVAQAEH